MAEQPVKIFVIGAGIVGLATAHELLSMAKDEGKLVDVTILANKISSPTSEGTNLVPGLDGFSFDEAQGNPDKSPILAMMRDGVARVVDIVDKSGRDCRLDMYYQFIGDKNPPSSPSAATDWLEGYFDYKASDFFPVDEGDRIKLVGFPEASGTKAAGQINVPLFQEILMSEIEKLGGKIRAGVHVERYSVSETGGVKIHSKEGVFDGDQLIDCAGAELVSQMGLPVPTISTVYTAASHVQLDPEDADQLSRNRRAIAFCDSNVDSDTIFWGALDRGGVLTLGFDPPEGTKSLEEAETAVRAMLLAKFHELAPQFGNKYDDRVTFSFGPMSRTDNDMPLVGKYGDVYVNTGYLSRCVAQCFAGGRAIAEQLLTGHSAKLDMLHALNSEIQPVGGPLVDPAVRRQGNGNVHKPK